MMVDPLPSESFRKKPFSTKSFPPKQCTICKKTENEVKFSKKQLKLSHGKCESCVDVIEMIHSKKTLEERKRCALCYKNLLKSEFSKRQSSNIDGKCKVCILESEKSGSSSTQDLLIYDKYYRCVRRKGANVRNKPNLGSPVCSSLPFGIVVCGSRRITNYKGDTFIKLLDAQQRDSYVSCRTLTNEDIVEDHIGPQKGQFYFMCVVEGCRVREKPDIHLKPLGYLIYGDVVEGREIRVTEDGLVFIQLVESLYGKEAWVLERTLDNESVLEMVEGPSKDPCDYQCVYHSGAPIRLDPDLSETPVGRIPYGQIISCTQRIVTENRQLFLAFQYPPYVTTAPTTASTTAWVIERTTCCASVMIKIRDRDRDRDRDTAQQQYEKAGQKQDLNHNLLNPLNPIVVDHRLEDHHLEDAKNNDIQPLSTTFQQKHPVNQEYPTTRHWRQLEQLFQDSTLLENTSQEELYELEQFLIRGLELVRQSKSTPLQ